MRIFTHTQAVRFLDPAPIAVVDLLFNEAVFNRFAQPIVDGALAEAGPLVHAAPVLAAPAIHELIDRDVLLETVFLVSPGVAQDVLHHLQLGDVVDLSRNVRPSVGHAEVIRLGSVEAGKWCSLTPASCHRSSSYRAIMIACYHASNAASTRASTLC